MFILLQLGFARDYLLSAAKSSQLLAHQVNKSHINKDYRKKLCGLYIILRLQFLWNMQANMYTDEEGSVKDRK